MLQIESSPNIYLAASVQTKESAFVRSFVRHEIKYSVLVSRLSGGRREGLGLAAALHTE